MRRIVVSFLAVLFSLGAVVPAAANPEAPTNGGSANGGGSSGQCTGAEADRPAACHNDHGSGN